MIIPVHLPHAAYAIHLNEPGTFTHLFNSHFPHRSGCVIVTNTTIGRLYEQKLSLWRRVLDAHIFMISDGESYKNMQTIMEILTFMVDTHFDRKCVIIAFGGGVVGDMAGFAASIFLRGVSFVQVPTTLLAMADSSVGGKTGINHPQGKNLIGSFYQPAFVWMDTAVLSTLPAREVVAGCGELLKCAFIGGRDLFDFMVDHIDELRAGKELAVTEGIQRCVNLKATIVAADEKESGQRMLLNFGHTFAHGLERYFHYEGILHGEAVLWGVVCACTYAKLFGCIPAENSAEIDSFISRFELPPLPGPIDRGTLHQALLTDKKMDGGKLRLVLPTQPGSAIIHDSADTALLMTTLQAVCAER